MPLRLALSALAVLLCCPAALAKKPASPKVSATKASTRKPERTPAPELAQLAYFTGRWKCDGKHAQDHTTHKSTMRFKLDLKKFWYSFDLEQTSPTGPLTGRGWLGYTSADHKYILDLVDTYGGRFDASSAGWNGDSLTFEGPLVGIVALRARYTFTRAGAKAYHTALEAQDDSGKWFPIYTEDCKKAG